MVRAYVLLYLAAWREGVWFRVETPRERVGTERTESRKLDNIYTYVALFRFNWVSRYTARGVGAGLGGGTRALEKIGYFCPVIYRTAGLKKTFRIRK